MTYTPREIAAEVAARFNDHDLAGLVALHAPDYLAHDNGQETD